MKKPHVLILAAGKGKRMYSALPKVLHTVLFRPMLHYVIDAAKAIPHSSVSMVVGHGEQLVRDACREYGELRYFVQKEQLGTAHAVRTAEAFLSADSADSGGTVLILSGDVMLLRAATLDRLMKAQADAGAACAVLTAKLAEPRGYGRILRKADGAMAGIREEADCTDPERAINEVNSGIYCFRVKELLEGLAKVSDKNRQKEFYLTDVVEWLAGSGSAVSVLLDDADEMTGINDRYALSQVEAIMQKRVNRELMLKGVAMRHPESVLIDPRCRIEPDTVIEGGCTLINSSLGAGAVIESGSRLVGSSIGAGSRIKQGCYIEESEVGSDCSVGPYAHLRPGTKLEADVKIGNFVELKKAHMGRGAKASHLSYIGDAEIGVDVNLGCGFITCNYDGFNKHKTIIEDGVFVGSDSQIVAPVRVGKGSYVASGTTVTADVPPDSLAISRVKQENKVGYAARLRQRLARASGKPPSGG